MEDFQSYILLFLASLVSAIAIRAILTNTRTNLRLPPSPLALPIIGHLHLLSPLPHQDFHELSSRLGPLFHLYLGSIPVVVVSSPDMAKEFLKTHETSFLNRPHLTAIDHLAYPSSSFIFGNFGPYLKFLRKLCASQLLGGKTLNRLAPIRSQELKRFLNFALEKACARDGFSVREELGKLTNGVVLRMAIGQTCSEDASVAEAFRKLSKESNDVAVRFNLSDFFWLFKILDLQGIRKICVGIHDKFDAILEKIVNNREETRRIRKFNGEEQDLLDILLDISEDENSEIRLNRVHIKNFILDILVAGTDTSSVTLEWALAELINHPNAMRKAREEIDSVVGKTRLVEESDIPNLPYIQAIAKETLRLHPASPLIFRESSESCTINGYHIPEKARVFVNAWTIGRDPDFWEDPLDFRPERFLAEQGIDVRGQNFHLLPFGSGRRSCPGAMLALQVVQTCIAAMVQCFEWEANGQDGVVDMKERPGIITSRAQPLVCVPIPRLSPMPI